MQRYLITLAALVLGLGILYYFSVAQSGTSAKGAFEIPGAPDYISTLLLALAGFLALIAGVALGVIYRILLARKASGEKKSSWRGLIAETWSSIDFQIGVVGSPLVFGVLWQGIAGLGLAQFLFIALQNGFAVHAVLGRIFEKAE